MILSKVQLQRWQQPVASGLRVALARLRFFLLLGTVLVVVAAWPWLRNSWDKLTRPAAPEVAISGDTEYWCPMCPGVVSDWPNKCPVCKMDLIRRRKGAMTPLPDGTLARMQFSPYRIQLAGIRTTTIDFQHLDYEIVLAGLIERESATSPVTSGVSLTAELSQREAAALSLEQEVKVTSESCPGDVFAARVKSISNSRTGMPLVRLEIQDPEHNLQPGTFASGRVAVPAARFAECTKVAHDAWTAETAMELMVCSVGGTLVSAGGLCSLLKGAVTQAAHQRDLVLAVPESAVVDTGKRKIVFVERTSGLFDAVEVRLGRRCGAAYPVLGGLEVGQAVVTSGAFLIDAETRLNPGAADDYFGAGGRKSGTVKVPAGSGSPAPVSPYGFSPEDQRLVDQQKICPVTGKPLGSMKTPVRVEVNGRVVFVCCKGCTESLKSEPAKYLAKLSGTTAEK